MTPEERSDLRLLLGQAVPFIRIDSLVPENWCRKMSKPNDKRIGPWQYTALYTVLNPTIWNKKGEVLYFVTDSASQLRLVGQSMSKLKRRWNLSPMYDIDSKQPLGRKALFHTTAWPAIEDGASLNENPPFILSALFRAELELICNSSSGPLARTLLVPETHRNRLSYHVESWVCSLKFQNYKLWNKNKVQD